MTISDHADASLIRGAVWSEDDTVLFAGSDGMYRVPAGGGAAPDRLELVADEAISFLGVPELLPDDRAMVFDAYDRDGGDSRRPVSRSRTASGGRSSTTGMHHAMPRPVTCCSSATRRSWRWPSTRRRSRFAAIRWRWSKACGSRSATTSH